MEDRFEKNNVTLFNILWVLGAVLFNVLFFFVPLAGQTGFNSAWEVSPFFGGFMLLVAITFLVYRIIILIKKW